MGLKVLIVGLGYAGTRFLRAFGKVRIGQAAADPVDVAYVDLFERQVPNRRFPDVRTALSDFLPDIVVVSVNDDQHARVLEQLHGFRGFVICEKPLTGMADDPRRVEAALSQTSGFCLDLIERYSEVTALLKDYIQANELRLVRANFCWAKDRINDRRPTCGVTSEVIHPLDLVQYICDPGRSFKIQGVLGSRSDFSISGDGVLDSVALVGTLGEAVVTGYSSFVNVTRIRQVGFTFASPAGKLVHAEMVFDTPEWDVDRVRVWERTQRGEQIHLEIAIEAHDDDPELKTIRKLVRLVTDVLGYVGEGLSPSQLFPDLSTALSLQDLLVHIEGSAVAPAPVSYVLGHRREFLNEGDWERLG